MRRWLIKSEPAAYGWADLVRDGATEWTGVRNHQAAGHLRAMAVGDELLFYHSVTGLEVVGIAHVVRAAAPDPTATAGPWISVEVAPRRSLPRPVSLQQIKAEPRLATLAMVRQSRLSVSPVSPEEWAVLLALGGDTDLLGLPAAPAGLS